jgi:hypothetical protein
LQILHGSNDIPGQVFETDGLKIAFGNARASAVEKERCDPVPRQFRPQVIEERTCTFRFGGRVNGNDCGVRSRTVRCVKRAGKSDVSV